MKREFTIQLYANLVPVRDSAEIEMMVVQPGLIAMQAGADLRPGDPVTVVEGFAVHAREGMPVIGNVLHMLGQNAYVKVR